MSPRTFVTRGATLFVLATLGLAACKSETVTPPPPPDVQVSVTPSTATLTTKGASLQYVALVTGVGTNGNTAVTWKSSDATIATVAASGNTATVTAVKNGTASIIATSVQDPTRSGAATVTVNIPADTSHPPAQPSVSIQSITDNNGHAVDNSNIQGLINVALNVDVPAGNAISSVNWLIDTKSVCSQTFTQGKSAGSVTTQAADVVTMTCQINTAQMANGKPVFANGAHTLSATLVGPAGTISAQTSQSLVFNNQNQISETVATTKNAIGANGFVWNGGNLTVTSKPVIFTGDSIARVTFTAMKIGAATSASFVDSTAADGFTATFRGDTTTGFLYNTTDSVTVIVSTITASGAQGPVDTIKPPIRFDNQAPAAVLFYLKRPAATNGGWINGSFKFSSAIDTTMTPDSAARAGAVDKGVDRVQYTFFAGPTRDSLTAVTKGSDLTDSNTATRYLVKMVETDALGNSTTVYGTVLSVLNGLAAADTTSPNGRFGVDSQTPTVVFDAANTVADTSKFTTNPTTANYVIGFQDLGASGFATATPVNVIEKADTGGGTVCVVGSGSTCGTTSAFSSNVPVDGTAGTQQGYVTMTAYVQDRASNKSTTLTRSVLVDYTAPVADSVQVTTSPLAGGASETFLVFLHDNVSLAKAVGQMQYTDLLGVGVPFIKALGSVSYSGYGSFTKTATASFTDPFFFTGLETSISGTIVKPTQLNVQPTDVAGNAGTNTGFTGAVSGLTAPTEVFTGATLTQTADTTTQNLKATLTIAGTAATVSPAASVRWFLMDNTTHVAKLIGVATNPVITVNGGNATFTYQVTSTSTLNHASLVTTASTVYAVYTATSGLGLLQAATIQP